MFQSDVRDPESVFEEPLMSSGDVLPLAPGALDRVRLGWLMEALVDDPSLIEEPTAAKENEAGARSASAEAHVASRVPRYFPAGVEDVPGGAVLAGLLAEVEMTDLGAYELVEYIAATERVAAAMQAWQASAVAEVVRRQRARVVVTGRPVTMPERQAALEVAARLTLSRSEGDALVSRAEYLTSVLPDTWAAWSAGVIDTAKAEVIGRRLARLDDELARRVEARVLPQAPSLTVGQLRRLIDRLVLELDPKDAAERHRQARERRCVWITPVEDGMAWLEAFLPAEDAAAVAAVLEAGGVTLKASAFRGAHNDGGPGDGGPGDGGAVVSAGNRRADVLAALAWAALAAGRVGGCAKCGCEVCDGGLPLARAHGRPVSVLLTVPASSVLGIDDRPGELAGMGPVTAEVARELATRGAVWRRVLTDPASGTVMDVGRTRYRPPADLAEHVMIRDLSCVWPGCDQPATSVGVDLDHVRAWAEGGRTADINLGPFCERHHGDKHEAGWQVTQTRPGRFTFRSPSGHTYTREPARVGPIIGTPDGRSVGEPGDPDPPSPPRSGDLN